MLAVGNYTASWLVKFYHSWPHFSFSFTLLKEEDYGFDNSQYLESLAMIALMSIVWLLLTMVGFAIYFCCLKGRGKSDSKYGGNGCYCSLCMLTVFLMFSLGGIGVALYGNMQSNDGLKVAAAAVHTGNRTFYLLNDQVMETQILNDYVTTAVDELKSSIPDDTDVERMEELVQKAGNSVDTFKIQLHGIEDRLAWSIQVLVVTERYRNLATFCLLGFQCIVCFLGLFGLCCRSKCTLIVTIVLGMICITTTYFYLGIDLLVNVGVSDFCMNPYTFIFNETVEKNYMSVEAANYFLKCDDSAENPFASDIEDGKAWLNQMLVESENLTTNQNLTDDQKDLLEQMDTNINQFKDQLDTINSDLDCIPTKQALDEFIPSICGSTVEGLFALAAAMFGIALCMTFALCAAAKTGKRYGKNIYGSDSTTDLDFHDPFLPRPTRFNSGSNRNLNITRTNNPIYATTASSNSNYGVASNTLSFFRQGSDEDVSLIETPPPYSPPHPTSRFTD